MKKALLIIILAISSTVFSQKIVENKVDEFTKKTIIRTDWEKISASSKLYLNVRISKIDDNSYLELKFFPKGVSSIDVDDDISFLFENGDIVNLNSIEYKMSNYGDGSVGLIGSNALGLYVDCKLSTEDIEKFKSNKVKKIRINKSEGYSEDELKAKNSQKFKAMFELMF